VRRAVPVNDLSVCAFNGPGREPPKEQFMSSNPQTPDKGQQNQGNPGQQKPGQQQGGGQHKPGQQQQGKPEQRDPQRQQGGQHERD